MFPLKINFEKRLFVCYSFDLLQCKRYCDVFSRADFWVLMGKLVLEATDPTTYSHVCAFVIVELILRLYRIAKFVATLCSQNMTLIHCIHGFVHECMN